MIQAALAPSWLFAQSSGTGLSKSLSAIAATPLGALPSVAPAMATSRDDTLLFGVRLQYGTREVANALRLTSYGLGADLQIQGRTLLSGLVGYQTGDAGICGQLVTCDTKRLMAGVRFTGNLVTTRPFLHVPFFTENDATGTAAIEIGAGWADRAFGERQYWSGDIAVPLSLSVGQHVRWVPFAVPTVAMVWGGNQRKWKHEQRILLGGGITAQEIGQWIGIRGLDLSVALKRAFSPHGTMLGATLSWINVP